MSTVTLPGEIAAPINHRADLTRIIALAVLAATLGAFLLAFTAEKLLFLYKEQLHLTPGGVGTLGIIVGIPSYLQPLMGAFSDLNPLAGYHRRSYFVLGGVLGAAGYLFLALSPHFSYAAVVALVMVGSCGYILATVILNAVLVVVGNATGTFGQLQTLLYLISYGWALKYTSDLRGYVTQHWSYERAFEAAAATLLAMTLLVFLIPETRRSRGETSAADPKETAQRNAERQAERARTLATLRSAARSPGLWVLVIFIFYLIVTPGTNTAQIYYETDALHLSKQFIGSLNKWTSAGVLAALLLYGTTARWLSARVLVWGAWLMDCAAYLLLLNIHDAPTAQGVSFAVALSGTIYGLCLYTLAGRACPVGAEGVVYGLVLSAIALGATLGDKLGGSLYDQFGPTNLLHHYSVAHGWTSMLWFGFGFTVLAAGFIPFLPAWTKSSERLSVQKTA